MKPSNHTNEKRTLYKPALFQSFQNYDFKGFLADLFAGLMVAIVSLPISITVAIACGIKDPSLGVYSAAIAGLISSFLGGGRLTVSGPSIVLCATISAITAHSGMAGLMIAAVLAGLILILMGIFKLGDFIRRIPYTVTTGLAAGLALGIAIGQLRDLLGVTFAPGVNAVTTAERLSALFQNLNTIGWQTPLVGGISLLMLILLPKINKKIPWPLVTVVLSILIVTCFDHIEKYDMIEGFHSSVNTIGHLYHIDAGLPPLPSFDLSGLGLGDLPAILLGAVALALLISVQSLSSCMIVDDMIGKRHHANTQLITEGIGNLCVALLGGIPVAGTVERMATSAKNGGKTPVSGIVQALVLLASLLFLMPYVGLIPMPTVAAVLLISALHVCSWRRVVTICKTASKCDILVMIFALFFAVIFGPVTAIGTGLILSGLLFSKKRKGVAIVRPLSKTAQNERLLGKNRNDLPAHTQIYELIGPICADDAEKLASLPVNEDCKALILHMKHLPFLDPSGARALCLINRRCLEKGTALLLADAPPHALATMKAEDLCDLTDDKHVFPSIKEALTAAEALCQSIPTE